ncbi:hypothetical protein DERP_013106 [Dermatophagoides pteronyssinus]|uniref:Uncharacterized protein n=1 Tax=Dermatophagoides pteronyssinus TaxID=6956 RepID=A0ABQ8J5N8_DERPT|nr:hypothetical protein DERP_013106 [Dermatophagoides pteronyssinus]
MYLVVTKESTPSAVVEIEYDHRIRIITTKIHGQDISFSFEVFVNGKISPTKEKSRSRSNFHDNDNDDDVL